VPGGGVCPSILIVKPNSDHEDIAVDELHPRQKISCTAFATLIIQLSADF
jgi:hypothetical protein